MLYRTFFLDSTINALSDNSAEAKELLRLIKEHNLWHCFIIPYTVVNEIESGSTPSNIKNALTRFIRTIPVELNSQEINKLNQLLNNAKGNAKAENINSDLKHIAEAAKYGAHYFVTFDLRLLKRNEKIKTIYPDLDIITLSAALKIVNEACNSKATLDLF